MNVTGFNALAEDQGFIVAYPNGVNNGWNTSSPFPGGSTADDVGYIGALRDTLVAQFSIDTTRIYATGFSAGGYMSHKLGCESPKCFAAIASVSGTINNGDVAGCMPQHTPGVLQIHGTSDFIVSYNGSVFSGLGVQAVLDRGHVGPRLRAGFHDGPLGFRREPGAGAAVGGVWRDAKGQMVRL